MKRIFVFALTIFVCSATAFGCNVCSTCAIKCRGSYGCYPFCQPECEECGSPLMKPYAEQLEPGLRLEQRDGYLTVMAVLPEAPATSSNIQIGDRILSVNGRAIGFGFACDGGWEFEHSGTSRVTLQRGGPVFDVVVALRPVKSLLASRWRATGIVKEVKFVEGQIKPPSMPYVFGVQLEQSNTGRLLVADILAASPADKAGIHIGDEIVSVNGVPPNQADEQIGYLAAGTDYREVIELGVMREGTRSVVRLQAQGISELLLHSETVERTPPMTAPIAKLSVEER